MSPRKKLDNLVVTDEMKTAITTVVETYYVEFDLIGSKDKQAFEAADTAHKNAIEALLNATYKANPKLDAAMLTIESHTQQAGHTSQTMEKKLQAQKRVMITHVQKELNKLLVDKAHEQGHHHVKNFMPLLTALDMGMAHLHEQGR
jgi:hypothetical protein